MLYETHNCKRIQNRGYTSDPHHITPKSVTGCWRAPGFHRLRSGFTKRLHDNTIWNCVPCDTTISNHDASPKACSHVVRGIPRAREQPQGKSRTETTLAPAPCCPAPTTPQHEISRYHKMCSTAQTRYWSGWVSSNSNPRLTITDRYATVQQK